MGYEYNLSFWLFLSHLILLTFFLVYIEKEVEEVFLKGFFKISYIFVPNIILFIFGPMIYQSFYVKSVLEFWTIYFLFGMTIKLIISNHLLSKAYDLKFDKLPVEIKFGRFSYIESEHYLPMTMLKEYRDYTSFIIYLYPFEFIILLYQFFSKKRSI